MEPRKPVPPSSGLPGKAFRPPDEPDSETEGDHYLRLAEWFEEPRPSRKERALQNWLAGAEPRTAEWVELQRLRAAAVRLQGPNPDPAEAWTRFKARVGIRRLPEGRQAPARSPRRTRRAWTAFFTRPLAAALLAISVLAVFFLGLYLLRVYL